MNYDSSEPYLTVTVNGSRCSSQDLMDSTFVAEARFRLQRFSLQVEVCISDVTKYEPREISTLWPATLRN